MIVVDQVPWVVLLMIGGMLMLGTWPAVWNKVRARSSVVTPLGYPPYIASKPQRAVVHIDSHLPCCCPYH
jgi:hypothetical protein